MLGNRKQDEINPRPDKDRQVEVADVLSNQFFNMFFWKKKLTCHQVRSALNSAKEICPSPSASTSLEEFPWISGPRFV